MPVDRKTTNRGILTKNFRRLTHYKKAPRLRGPRKLAIPSRGILAERSSSSRVRFAAKNALLTAAGRSAHFSAKKECEVSGPPQY